MSHVETVTFIAKTLAQIYALTEKVYTSLETANLKLAWEKCEFVKTSLTFSKDTELAEKGIEADKNYGIYLPSKDLEVLDSYG